jgi:hypothetical protein
MTIPSYSGNLETYLAYPTWHGIKFPAHTVSITPSTDIKSGKIGSDQEICYNTQPNAFTSIEPASGGAGALSYSWQNSTDNSTFVNIPGEIGNTYTPPSLTTTTYYRRGATNNCGTVYSDAIKVTVLQQIFPGTIDASQTILSGHAPATLTSTSPASGGTGALSYQWQKSTDGTTWSDISSATSTTYPPLVPTVPTYYRQKVTDEKTCEAFSNTVKIFPIKPLSLEYVACQGASVTIGFAIVSGETYNLYNVQTGGTPISTGSTFTVTKDGSLVQTLWVEPIHNGNSFPRYQVDLNLSSNCGTDPTGCAVDGTMIWKQDFGGLASDPVRAPDPGWQATGITTYIYVTRPNILLPDVGQYALLKYTPPQNWAYKFGDHTTPLDDGTGYFLTFDATTATGEFYNLEISDLCPESTLTFSAWLMNINPAGFNGILPNVEFRVENNGTLLSSFSTGNIVRQSSATWLNYSFQFTVPSGVTALKVRMMNNVQSANGEGNDIAIDDIEVRFCAPPVTTNITNNDTVVCSGTELDIIGTYIDDCTFNGSLEYQWEFRHIDSVSWKQLGSVGTKPIDCTGSLDAKTLVTTLAVLSISSANEGYYRLIVGSPSSIGSVNCRAVSDSVYVKVIQMSKSSDIRLDVCPLPDRSIYLSSHLYSPAYNTVNWTKISFPAPNILDTQTGEIKTAGLTGTYKYVYSMTSKCGTSSAIAYVHPLKNAFRRTIDTIVVCKDEKRSRNVHINQILGLEVYGGTWDYDYPVNPDDMVVSKVKTIPNTSSFFGAVVFDAYQAWVDASHTGYSINYRGDTNAKKFVFHYIANDTCIGAVNKEIVIIVTGTMF